MPAGKYKSRTLRRVYIRTPGGETKLHYRIRNMPRLRCSICKKELHGIPRLIPSKFKNLPKTKKRPERPYGGILCSKCMRKKIKENFLEH